MDTKILETFAEWRTAGREVALATIVHVQGSALRLAGARMGLNNEGEVTRSVSGGCIDSDALAQMEALTAFGQEFGKVLDWNASLCRLSGCLATDSTARVKSNGYVAKGGAR